MTGSLQRILYVEDEPDIRAIAKLSLESVGGFDVMICTSGEEAIEKAAEFDPDLILLDVMMPVLDGPATLARLREIPTLAETPVLFFTAKAMPNEIERFKDLGALDVISKPFDPLTLPDQIRAAWAGRSAVNGA